MTNSGKRRRSEKRARAQLEALYDASKMPSNGTATSAWGGREWQQNKIGLARIDDEIFELKKKLLIIR